MKLPGSIENKTRRDKNGENVPHPEITEVLVHCNVNNDYQQDSKSCTHLFHTNRLVVY